MPRLIDRTGEKRGLWKVIRRATAVGVHPIRWLCVCTGCGTQHEVGSPAFSPNSRLSYGCSKCRAGGPYTEKPKKDLSGLSFGKLIAVCPVRCAVAPRWRWECRCECGGTTIAATADLERGSIKSCGCLRNLKGASHPSWRGCGQITGEYWSTVRNNAKLRGLAFNITIEEAWSLLIKQNTKCALTGATLYFRTTRGAKKKRKGTASLDRIDSSKGYEKDNVQWIHKHINRMKGALGEEYFIELCRRVVAGTEHKNNDKETEDEIRLD